MKITHNTHGWSPDTTDPAWAEKVEREAAAHTARTEAAWHKALRRHARAVVKAEQAAIRPEVSPERRARLWRVVSDRLSELKAIESLMTTTPAGAQHRGRGSHRGVSTGGTL